MKSRFSGAAPLHSLWSLRIRTSGLIFLFVSALSGGAHAQYNPESQHRAWDLSFWASGATGEETTNSFAEAQIFSAGVFVGHSLGGEVGTGRRRGRFQYGADFVPVFVQFAPQKITGTAFDPFVLRWISSAHRGRVSLFVELGGGGLHTSVNFPRGNTSTFNFIARGGGGILITTKPSQAVELACRWWHISNANLGSQNPEFNGIQVSLGWHWFK